MYDDNPGPDEFDELDKVVEFAKEKLNRGYSPDEKIYISSEMINLMLEEVPECHVRIYEQIGGNCVAEIKYRGFNFISVSPVQAPKPS